MMVIPAIDLLGGRVVRLRRGRYDDVTVYDVGPVELAQRWSRVVGRVHVVDLDGARCGEPIQRDLVREIVAAFGAGVQVGGGIRTTEAVRGYLEGGADRVVLGTAAVRDPDLVREATDSHPRRVVLAVDAKDGLVAVDGWSEVSQVTAVGLVRHFADHPLAAVLYTDIERDGTEAGINVEATRLLAVDGGLPVIASGGVGTLEHLRRLAATARHTPGLEAVIVGRALHEGRFSLEEAVRVAADVRSGELG